MVEDDEVDRSTHVTDVVPLTVEDEATARINVALRLVCVAGADLGRTFKLERSPLTIGRGIAEVALHAKDVSRAHARLAISGDGFVVEDLQSANGTFVNGVGVEAAMAVWVGDGIWLGR